MRNEKPLNPKRMRETCRVQAKEQEKEVGLGSFSLQKLLFPSPRKKQNSVNSFQIINNLRRKIVQLRQKN